MMVNTVPSYCVSLDILLSEYSIPNSARNQHVKSEPTRERSTSVYRVGIDDQRLRAISKSKDHVLGEMKELLGKKTSGETSSDIKGTREYQIQSKRWFVLAIYCCASFMQAVVWNTWSPIASAALYAFPSWTPGTVALFSNWGCVCFLAFIVPICWMLNEKGLKFGCVVGSILCTVGSGIRCFPNTEDMFTVCAHACAIMNALGGVIFAPSAILLSSTWFPADQRASATGVGTAISALGMAGSYLLGPSIISLPIPDYPMTALKEKIKHEIFLLMCSHFIIHFVIFWLVVLYFPSCPKTAASQSSLVSMSYHRGFVRSIKMLIRNGNIWLLGLSAALNSGMTSPWLSQLTILFAHSNFTSTELARLGFWTIVSSCLFSLTAARFSDMFQGHIKAILFGLVSFATLMFFWVYNLVRSDVLVNKHYLIQAVIAGFSASWATSPLFYELGAEIAYPVPEGIVAGYIMCMSSISCVFAYAVFYMISGTGIIWLNCGLVAYNIGSLILLLLVKEQYNRLAIDG